MGLGVGGTHLIKNWELHVARTLPEGNTVSETIFARNTLSLYPLRSFRAAVHPKHAPTTTTTDTTTRTVTPTEVPDELDTAGFRVEVRMVALGCTVVLACGLPEQISI